MASTKDDRRNSAVVVGEVDENGYAHFKQPLGEITPPKSKPPSIDGDQKSINSAYEDYDERGPDPMTVMDNGKGGGLKAKPALTHHVDEDHLAVPPSRRPGIDGRRKSIPIQLEKTKRRGEYLLRADDPDIQEVLRRTLAREADNITGHKRRPMFSDLVFTKQFTAFDPRNPLSGSSPFHGFFTLFWLSIAFMLLRVASSNWRMYGSIFGRNKIMQILLTKEVFEMFAVDVVMMISGVVSVALQKMIARGWIRWNTSGWIIQSVWEFVFLFGTLAFANARPWQWSHNVFIVLHAVVILMKQHSYGFYNGYLSEIQRRKKAVERKRAELYEMDPYTAATATPTTAFASSYFDQQHVEKLKRRISKMPEDDKKTKRDTADIEAVVQAIQSGVSLNLEQFSAFKHVLKLEVESLNDELRGKCSVTKNYYPSNLSYISWFEYIPLPTVVYELEYPRQESIDWTYVLEKTIATFGCLGVMIVVSEAYIYPVVMRTIEMKDAGLSLYERLQEFPWIIDDLLFPFMLEYLLSWYVIWECILNVLAELTRFADRGFYSDWWNSVSWDQFARDWNKPVHNFLLRHVYHSSISAFKVNKQTATLITFLLSALIHELVMWCIFKRLRGYLMILQMTQLPLAMLSRMRFMKNQLLLGNIMFWIGIFTGPSLLCSLYLII